MISGLSKRIKRFLLSRATVIALMCLILLTVLIGALVPQKFIAPESEMFKWKAAHPWLAPWARRLGLDHVYTTPWFAFFLLLAFISLSLSSFEQFRAARRKTFKTAPVPAGEGVHIDMAEEGLVRVLRRRGYLPVVLEGPLRFVKHPWGYWGNFLLHLGMVVTIAASLFVALTQKRAALYMYEGHTYQPGVPWDDEEYGMLADEFVLPDALRLNRVRASFWPNGKVKQVLADVSFFPTQGAPEEHTVGVSNKLSYKGVTIYQGTEFGDAFTLDFRNTSGKWERIKFQMLHPQSVERPTFRDLTLPWLPYLLQTAYYVDAERKSIGSTNPDLGLRLKRGEEVIGPLSLKVGEIGELGQYKVRLVRVMKWTGLLFVDVKGMPFIFLGFFVIVLGSSLGYFTPPRELVAVKTDSGYTLYWRATRFKEFYTGEYDKILKTLGLRRGDE